MSKRELYDKVLSHITPELCIEFTSEVVQHRSTITDVVAQENPSIISWIANKMEAAGMQVQYLHHSRSQTMPIPHFTTNPSVIGILGNPGGPTLMLEAHYDTQGVDPSTWEVDPFAGVVKDGAIWGRGALDSKGQLAAMLAALHAIKKSGVELKGCVKLISAPDGEFGQGGWRAAVESGLVDDVDWVLAGEATWWEEEQCFGIALAHYGSVNYAIETYGIPSHEWRDQREGVHAVWEMNKVLNALDTIEFTHEPWQWYKPRLTILSIKYEPDLVFGGELKCRLTGMVFTVPGMTYDSVEEDFRRVLDEIRRQDGKLEYDVSVAELWGPCETSVDDPLVVSLREACKEIQGKEPKLGAFELVVDGAQIIFYTKNPDTHIGKPFPVTFGGGDFRLAHISNERIGIENQVQTTKIYARAILDLVA